MALISSQVRVKYKQKEKAKGSPQHPKQICSSQSLKKIKATLDPHTHRVQLCHCCSPPCTTPVPSTMYLAAQELAQGTNPAWKYTNLGSFSGRLLLQVGSSRSLTVSTQKGLHPCSGGPRAERAEPKQTTPATQGLLFHAGQLITPGCPCSAAYPPSFILASALCSFCQCKLSHLRS